MAFPVSIEMVKLAEDKLGRKLPCLSAAFMLMAIAAAAQSGTAQQYFDQGIKLYENNRYSEAIRQFQLYTQLEPSSDGAFYNIGLCYSNLNRPREAWSYFQKAVQLKSDSAMNWCGLGKCYFACGDKSGAEMAYRECLKRDPKHQQAKALLSSLLQERGQKEQALQLLNTLKVETTTDQSTLLAEGQALVDNGKIDQAIVLYRRCLALSPSNSDLHRYLAYLLNKQQQYALAITEWKEAIKAKPEDANLYLALISAYGNAGQLDEKLKTQKDFVVRFPKHPETASIKDQIEYYAKDYKSISEATKTSQPTYTPDDCWNYLEMPLKVYVHDRFKGRTIWSADGLHQGTAESTFPKLIEDAFWQWTQASKNKVTFVFQNSPDDANIECDWTDDPGKLFHSFTAGEAAYSKNKIGQRCRKLYLLTVSREDRKPIAKDEFLAVTLHEIGHALGLSHSGKPEDIMFVAVTPTPHTHLSANDKSRLLKLYP